MSQDWAKVVLPRARAHDGGQWKLLQDSFEEMFMVLGGPGPIALFHRSEGDGDEVFYFSPAAAAQFDSLWRLFHGEHCKPPIRQDIGLIIGRQPDAWDLLPSNV